LKKNNTVTVCDSLSFSSCEKDDICDANTVTTPRLVISFMMSQFVYLKSNESKITGEGMTDGVVFNGSLINGSTVSIPLKTNADATTFSFILNSGSTNPALVNEDILKFNYAREEFLYLERVVLKLIYSRSSNSYVHTDAAIGDQNGFNTSQLKTV
jgi:hypothetical protein